MSENTTHATQSPKQAMVSRQMFTRSVIAGAIIAGSVLALWTLQQAFALTLDKPPMPLQQPLSFLPRKLGDSVAPARYVADADDSTMNEEMLETLGTREYLLRRYVDTSQPAGSVTQALHVNLNYYGSGMAVPHVPEICWAAAGMVEAGVDSRRIFEIPDVKRRDGRLVTLRMNMISFMAPGSDNPAERKYVAYMFEVNGDYVATPKEVVSRFWKASNKYAYNTKIEVTVGDKNKFCTYEEAQKAISDFIRVALPDIEACMPDPREEARQEARTRK